MRDGLVEAMAEATRRELDNADDLGDWRLEQRIARANLDAAVGYLSEHVDEWIAEAFPQEGFNDDEAHAAMVSAMARREGRLLAVLREDT